MEERTPLKSNNAMDEESYYSYQLEGASPRELELTPLQSASTSDIQYLSEKKSDPKRVWMYSLACFFGFACSALLLLGQRNTNELTEGAAWSSKAAPFSTVDPTTLGVLSTERPWISRPGKVFGDLVNKDLPLPTNSWFQNFLLGSGNDEDGNKVFQVPYILDIAGSITGIRTHACHVQANDRMVMMTHDMANGLTLGAVENLPQSPIVHSQGTPAFSKLAIELEWSTDAFRQRQQNAGSSAMRAPIVRGSPYTSVLYFNATPRLHAERVLKGPIVIDQGRASSYCNNPHEIISVQKEMKIAFDSADLTWLIFLSEPMQFTCKQFDATSYERSLNLPPGVVSGTKSSFDLVATKRVLKGMVRVAMSNNCTSGQNPEYCGQTRQPRDASEYEFMLRQHADIYPTARADIEFTFPTQSSEEEELRLIFKWQPASMAKIASSSPAGMSGDDFFDDPPSEIYPAQALPPTEILMFALPHHQERMRPTIQSSNKVLAPGCMPTIHGIACPAVGNIWSLLEHLHRTSFYAIQAPRAEMLDSLTLAALDDLKWRIPPNYMIGAGDTYFSGKLLARLARILLISDEVGLRQRKEFADALSHLRDGVEIWINGRAQSPFLYDRSWGGLVMCGCDYTYEDMWGHCRNSYPSCPALEDMGQNFGAGFYNDHHYHFGYHIYAAAVVSKFDAVWGRKWHQHVLLLIRDIANPSNDDIYFPTWRHKDWYVGFSWASGVVTIGGRPYPNGRNQESVSEAIAAYEAVAMYGDVMSDVFFGSNTAEDLVLYDTALRTRDMGRLLMCTEIRSAKTYWHVQERGTPGVSRIYPDVYEPKVIGMIWSMMAQEQTWFGSEVWKSYGIQILPLTPAAELRDDPSWVAEMLPKFEASCLNDPVCVEQGWSVIVYTSWATVGRWQEAWEAVKQLDPSVFESAGGNGHSLTNTLWYIATRPEII
eukprot:CAMPEP_0173139988 /NCGR_PEP_ID=MMETSP1105-20130129/4598_1 /TAXON_ID=2985 /ORGANISM="Ochromonas sp., Strain BG-1" /LENGTH=938 /DNA_ID=CAMNT_0014052849 /DNA_START=75 /DNA_END=2891 /DNA_ORIENTATION=+